MLAGYLFRPRVRSWQKALAGAARRIRCHSHPRMLLHSRSSCPLGRTRSFALSARSLPRPFAPFQCTRSFTVLSCRRVFLVLLERAFFLFRLTPLFVHCLRRSRTIPYQLAAQARATRSTRLIHKPINVGNKLKIDSALRNGQVSSDVCVILPGYGG